MLAMTSDAAAGHAINIGSGQSVTVNEIAARLARILGKEHLEPEITGKYRVGDIRHCFADIALAEELLGFHPQVEMDHAMAELAEWLEGQVAVDSVDAATAELATRGLTV
jgi:dTDP-L-rhamnose 4-epimerase